MCRATEVQLHQVLLNIIINACDAMAEYPPQDRIIEDLHRSATRQGVCGDGGSGTRLAGR